MPGNAYCVFRQLIAGKSSLYQHMSEDKRISYFHVQVTLQLTVRQPVCLGVEALSGTHD
jgi:hypothetical protein